MKNVLVAAALLLPLAACGTMRERAQEDAFQRCADIADDKARKDCTSDAVAQAQRERYEEQAREAEESQARQDRAAINQAYGAPESATRED